MTRLALYFAALLVPLLPLRAQNITPETIASPTPPAVPAWTETTPHWRLSSAMIVPGDRWRGRDEPASGDDQKANPDAPMSKGTALKAMLLARATRHKPTELGYWPAFRSPEDRFARRASDSEFHFIAMGFASMLLDGKDGRRDALRGARAMLTTAAITVGVKKLWRRRRPYPNDYKFGSFPSGHTSSAMTMATVLASSRPRYGALAYSAASTIGWSRVKVRAHHWYDVFAGATLGYVVGRKFMK